MDSHGYILDVIDKEIKGMPKDKAILWIDRLVELLEEKALNLQDDVSLEEEDRRLG